MKFLLILKYFFFQFFWVTPHHLNFPTFQYSPLLAVVHDYLYMSITGTPYCESRVVQDSGGWPGEAQDRSKWCLHEASYVGSTLGELASTELPDQELHLPSWHHGVNC